MNMPEENDPIWNTIRPVVWVTIFLIGFVFIGSLLRLAGVL